MYRSNGVYLEVVFLYGDGDGPVVLRQISKKFNSTSLEHCRAG